MAAFEKYKANQCKFLIGHSKHRYSALDEHIDMALTKNNIEFVARDMDYLQQRLSDLNCSKRSDVNVLAELIVTLPKEFRGSSEEFFACVHRFAVLNYKEQNIIYSEVHRDEPAAREHIHIGFIPTVYDSKKKKTSVSYDRCVHKRLDKFHPKLSEYCEKEFGYDVGIMNGATKDGNKSIEQLKAETKAREDIARLEAERAQLLREQEALLSVPDKIIVSRLKSENEQLKKYNRTYFEFIKQMGLVKKFMEWFAKVTGKNAQKTDIERS